MKIKNSNSHSIMKFMCLTHNPSILSIALLALFSIQASAQIQFGNVTNGSGIIYTGESYGGSWGELNGDGWPDLFVTNHRNRPDLFVNNGDGTFTNMGSEVNTWVNRPNDDTHGGSWADFDNDGDQDLYVTAGSADDNQFFINEGGILTDHTAQYDPAVPKWRSRLPIWFDYTDDGLLDFMMASENQVGIYEQSVSGFIDRTTQTGLNCNKSRKGYLADLTIDNRMELICADSVFPLKIYATDTLPFTNLTSLMPKVGYALDVALGDFDGNLRQDMFMIRGRQRISEAAKVSNRAMAAHLIVSGSAEKGFNFQESGTITVSIDWDGQPRIQSLLNKIYIGSTGWHPASTTFSLSSSDSSVRGIKSHKPANDQGIYIEYDESAGRWIFLLSPGGNWSQAYFDVTGNATISGVTTTGREIADKPMQPALVMNLPGGFQNQALTAGLGEAIQCAGGVTGDFDNDMDLDLYLVCRSGVRNLSNRLYENLGNGTFAQVPGAGGAEGIIGTGIEVGTGENSMVADYDVDGFLDLFVTNGTNMIPEGRGGPSELFHNLGNANHWIELDLVGTVSNRDGIGAKVYATTGGVTQLREQNGGYHRWSQNHQRIHFGLASNQLVNLEVRWPNGMVDTFSNVDADRLYRVTEGGVIEEIPIGSVSPGLRVSNVTVAEDAGQADFTVNLSGDNTQTVTVDYATADGTAAADSDYTAVSEVLTFLPGQTTNTVHVPILDDTLPEGTEAFTVTLSNASGAGIINGTGTATITDNDASPCGEPSYNKATESAVFVWKNCSDASWHARVTAGGQSLNYVGTIDADQPFSSVSPFQLAGADILDFTSDPTQIAYSLFVGNAGQDGADFTFPAGANVCFGVDAPAGIPVLLGAARTPMTVPFDLNNLGPCTILPPPPSPCGEPSYDKATESAVFVWKNCSDDSWHARVTAGGQSLNYVGTIDADQPFSSVNPFQLAGADILDFSSDPTQIAYSFFVGNAGQDGADFTFPAGANVCFGVDAPAGIPVLLGTARAPMTVPFDLNTLATCP